MSPDEVPVNPDPPTTPTPAPSRRRMRLTDWSGRQWLAGFAVIAVAVYVFVGLSNSVGIDLPNLPNPFGHDGDDQAHGSLRLEGQSALTATDSLVVKIGEGEATVAIKAHQNWDKPGGPFPPSFDFQSTNGTASVRDPDEHDQPATITVGVDYCADGRITRRAALDSSGEPASPDLDVITYDMGELFICGVHWLPTAENEGAFSQDDTPADFQGAFEELIKNAAVTAVEASECPDTLVENYTTDDYLDFVAEALAEREGVPRGSVEVTAGTQGNTSAETQAELLQQLEDFVATNDLDIDAFSGSGTAVEDSCFVNTRGESLDELNDVQVPDPRDQL